MKKRLLQLSFLLTLIAVLTNCTDSDLPGSKELEIAGTTWDFQLFFTTEQRPGDEYVKQSGHLDLTFNADGTIDMYETYWQYTIHYPDGSTNQYVLEPEDLSEPGLGIGAWTLEGDKINFHFGESVNGDWQFTGIILKGKMTGEYTYHNTTETTWEAVKY